jgi:hypothetical protein
VKLTNRLANFSFFHRVPIKGPALHSFVAGGSMALAVFFLSWHQERDADITSATSLDLLSTARNLVEKKIIQNHVYQQLTDSKFITKNNNDLLEWSHPPLTYQRQYLLDLEKKYQ